MVKLARVLLIGFTVGLLGGTLALTRTGIGLEDSIGLYWLFTARGRIQPPPEVVIINVDRDSAVGLGRPNKLRDWPRTLHADLIDTLVEHGASAIVFDIFFEQARPGEDAAFAEAIARSRRVVLFQQVMYRQLEIGLMSRLVDPTPKLAAAARGLAPFVLPDVPQRINQCWRFLPVADYVPTLPIVALQLHVVHLMGEARLLALLKQAGFRKLPDSIHRATGLRRLMDTLRIGLKEQSASTERLLRIGEEKAPSQEAARAFRALIKAYRSDDHFLNFYGPQGTLTIVPYDGFWSNTGTGQRTGLSDVAGKIVFVGNARPRSDLGQGDRFLTVFSKEGSQLSGVEVAATVLANLLKEDGIKPVRPLLGFALVFAFGLIAGMLSALLPGIYAGVLAVGFGALYYGVAQILFTQNNLWLPVFIPLAVQLPLALPVGLLAQYLIARRQREKVRRAIRYYVPESVAHYHESHDDLPAAELKFATCLVSDVANYTTLSEKLPAMELAALNREYFEMLGKRIKTRRGEIRGIVGDGMTCVWESRQPDRELRLQASLAGLDLLGAVERFNRRHPGQTYPTRIGIHAGWVTIGHMGGGGKFTYAVIGDIVNTASRIEGLNKYLGTGLLVAEPVVAGLSELLLRPMGRYLFKHKSDVLTVFEIMGQREQATAAEQTLCTRFAAALAVFYEHRWSEAAALFADILREYPLDGPAGFYLQRCRENSTGGMEVADRTVIRLSSK